MNRRTAATVGVVGLLLIGLLVVQMLASQDWNPTVLVRFGEAFSDQLAYAEHWFGEVIPTPEAGHDGKFFLMQAMDPFYLEPEIHALHLDRPAYRAQRMLYPTLASLGGLLSPTATVWGLIVVNVLAHGVGAYYTALVAMRLGLSAWFGLAFTLNPGLLAEVVIDGGGVVAMAALMAGLYFALMDRFPLAAVALSLAALSRETMLVSVIGVGLYQLVRRKRFELVLAWPLLLAIGWWGYLRWRLGEALSQDTEALSVPLSGLYQSAVHWLDTPGSELDALVAVAVLAASIGLVLRSVRAPSLVAWSTAGFAVLALLLSEPVWLRFFDSSRAVAPVFTAYVLVVLGRSTPLQGGRELKAEEPASGKTGLDQSTL